MSRRGLLATSVIVLLAGAPASAQPKDPFRPPGSSSVEAPPADAPAGAHDGIPASDPGSNDDGLARTGQDIRSTLAVGAVFLALGLAFRLLERVARPSRRGRRGRRGRPSGAPRVA
ncbi:MAG: hypothetical protein ACRDJ1_08880 [Actinomycetota bacterium]